MLVQSPSFDSRASHSGIILWTYNQTLMEQDRDYELHLILTSPTVRPWEWLRWQQVVAILGPVVSSVFGTPSTYSCQLERTAQRATAISFGRMTWSEPSHHQWTHGSPVTRSQSDNWEFLDTQIWVPGRRECERERKRPNLYLQLLNGAVRESEPVRFGAVVLVAVAYDLPETVRRRADLAMGDVAHLLQAKLRAYKIRPWSHPFGVLRSNSIADLVTWLFKLGPRHAEEPSLAMFYEEWQAR